ncbi:PAS domain S-box protein [Heliobacterium mobile]|uniref:PAS domain S-box protein n=1 Tax=Heliobacterium mobile TaxID=28064 RepID=UPI00147908CA|nr:PAS domain S-box protein [Heliobacterium mobile]
MKANLSWGQFLPQQITKRILYSMVVLVVLHTVILTGIVHLGFLKKERFERMKDLQTVTAELDQRLSEQVIHPESIRGDWEERSLILEKTLRPETEALSQMYPGLVIGYYSNALGRTVAYSERHEYHIRVIDYTLGLHPLSFLNNLRMVRELPGFDLETVKPDIPVFDNWRNDPMIYISHSVYREGWLVGYCWAVVKPDDFHTAVLLRTAEIISIELVLAILLIFEAWRFFTRFKGEIEGFGQAVVLDTQKLPRELLPELNPLLEKLESDTRSIKLVQSSLSKEIAKRVRAEKELNRFFDVSVDILILIDLSGHLRRWNPALEHRFGYSEEELADVPFTDFVHPDDIEAVETEFRWLLSGEPTVGEEIRFRSKDGNYRWMAWNAVPDLVDGTIYAVGRDMTARRQSVEDLRVSEERFSKAFYANPNPMYIYCIDKDCLFEVNESFLRITGWRREEVIGRSLQELHLSKPSPREKVIRNRETYFNTQNGEKRIWLLSAEQIELGSRPCYLYAINDITELRWLEKEMARLDRLNLVAQMAAGIGHEIRNPMTTVRGFLQILAAKDESIHNKNYYDLMIEELDRANSIITEFLSLAKSKVDDPKIQSLNQIIKTLYPMMEANASLGKQFLRLELGQIPDLLLGEKEIRQLLLNLVRNGLEAMTAGQTLTIKTYLDSDSVVLAVQDEGPGIESSLLEKLGTPFFTTKDQGTGLGLAICHNIAARHQAVIIVESGNQGTTFYVRFPFTPSTETKGYPKKETE